MDSLKSTLKSLVENEEKNEEHKQDEYMEGNESSNKTQSVSVDKNEMDLFSPEVVDNEILCVCNLCDRGLDNERPFERTAWKKCVCG